MFLANSLWALGTTLCERGDLDGAETCLTQSLMLARSLGDKYVTSGSLRDLGVMLTYRGKYKEAIGCLEDSLALAQQANFQFSAGWIISALGFAVLGGGDYARAEALFRESVELGRGTVRHRLPDNLEGLAAVELERARRKGTRAQAHRSATLVGAAANVRRILGMKVSPARVAAHDKLIADIRSRLSGTEFERSSSLGQMMGLEEAIRLALTP